MARSWRQNVIMSHGGRHGRSHTYRKGRTVPPGAARAIPDAVLGQTTEEVPAPKAEPPVVPRPPEPGDRPSVRALLEAGREMASKAADTEAVQSTPKRAPEPVTEAPEEVPVPRDPKTKKDLFLLRKADVEALAEKHGIKVDEGTKGRTKMLRDLLRTKLDL